MVGDLLLNRKEIMNKRKIKKSKNIGVFWILGPEKDLVDGVGRYSQTLISEFENKSSLDIITNSIPYEARTIRRYLYQFIALPIILVMYMHRYSVVVLSQENFVYLLPLIKLIGKRSVVIYHHIPDSGTAQSLIERFKIFYLKVTSILLNISDKVISPSIDAASQISLAFNIDERKSDVVYNSFDLTSSSEVIDKKCLLNSLGIKYNGNERIVLNVGTDETRKNLFCFLQGFSEVDQSNYLFIKAGRVLVPDNDAKMKAYIEENSLNAHFLEYVSDDLLMQLYDVSDIYVSPSLQEGFGRTVIEAQFHGAMVIASKISVYDEIMPSCYIPVDEYTNSKCWGTVLGSIAGNDSMLITRGKINASRFSSASTSKKFLSVIRSLNIKEFK